MEIPKKIEWHPDWEPGAPMPQVFPNGQKIYLVYIIADWEKDSLRKVYTIQDPNNHNEILALVEFEGHTFRFGIANDEVFSGLSLYGRGLKEAAHVIENSEWIEEIKQIHKVHPSYNELSWSTLKDYILLFKDEILEVIARSYKIDVYKTSYKRKTY